MRDHDPRDAFTSGAVAAIVVLVIAFALVVGVRFLQQAGSPQDNPKNTASAKK